MKAFFENRDYKFNIPISVFDNKGLKYMAHWHTEVEIIYVYKGTQIIGINKNIYTLKSGDIAICKSNDIHYYVKSEFCEQIVVIFKPDYIGYNNGWPENVYLKNPVINIYSLFNDKDKNSIKSIFFCILNEFKEKKIYYDVLIKSKIIELCAYLLRYNSTITLDNNEIDNKSTSILLMQKAILFIQNNYMNNLNIKYMSEYLHISQYYFSHLFKNITGMNFKTYLNTIRIDKAQKYIEETNLTILSIAMKCGFNSIRTFNRAYKQSYGYSPSEYNFTIKYNKEKS